MTVGFDGLNSFVERQAAIETPPLTGVAMPLEVEAVAGNPVEASEGRVEFFAEVVWEAGAVALDKAILRAAPFAEDIDGVVELGQLDFGQEPGFMNSAINCSHAAVTRAFSASVHLVQAKIDRQFKRRSLSSTVARSASHYREAVAYPTNRRTT